VTNNTDVLIIGSGISSLTAALLLAKRGKSVTILEQYSKPGGYLHCFNRFGERYDTGAHYVGALDPGQPFHTLLTYLGVYDDELFIPLDPAGFDILHFPNFKVSIPKGYAEVERELRAQFAGEHEAIRKYFELVRQAVTHFPTYHFDAGKAEVASTDVFETSLADVVNGLTSNSDLQCVFYSYCTLHGVKPQDVGFGFHAIVTDSLIRSAYGLRKGGDALAKKFVTEIEKHGGRVLLNKRVSEIKVRDRLVSEVTTADGDTFSAEWIISGIHPKKTFALVDNSPVLTPAFELRMKSIKESIGLFGVYTVCDPFAFHHLKNYYFFDSSDPKSFSEFKSPIEIPATVFLSPARRESIPGKSSVPLNIHAAGPLDWFSSWQTSAFAKRPEAYKILKRDFAENVFKLIDRYYPGFRDSVMKYETSSPLTNIHFNGSEEGSAYGIYHSMQNTGPRALGPRTKVLNLLLTGQSCLFPGLLGAAISGLRTSGHIIGIKPMLGELKELGESA
jgi:all-trans-retinol 13,14-reductase